MDDYEREYALGEIEAVVDSSLGLPQPPENLSSDEETSWVIEHWVRTAPRRHYVSPAYEQLLDEESAADEIFQIVKKTLVTIRESDEPEV